MLRLVILKEWRELYRDGRLRLAVFALFALVTTAVAIGARDSERLRAERATARARNVQQWFEQGRKNPHTAAHYGMYVFREPGPLSFFDRGVLSYAGGSVFLEAHKQNLPVYAEARDGTLARRLGEWTAAHVLGVLVPLLIVLLTFGAFASERERGLLLQVESLGGSLRRYVWGKFCGIASALAVLLLPVLVGALLVLFWAEGAPSADQLGRAGLLGVTYGCYFAVVLAVCLAVSASARSARRALVVLLGLWAAWTLLLPRASADLARALHPTARFGEIEIQLAREQGLTADSAAPYEDRVHELRQKLLKEYGVERAEDLPVNFGGVVLLAGEEWGNAAFDRHLGAVQQSYRAQHGLLRLASWLTPSLAAAELSRALSGTSLDDELGFVQAAERFRRDLVRRMNEEVRDHPSQHGPYLAGAELWRQVPGFVAPKTSIARVLDGHVLELGVLSTWLGLSLALLVGAARRLERQSLR